ncbi:putative O-glycosylation ligase, exosortase A system-associated [bacterium]|nr:putative O-glycosylation ligase, exosortase A system-associated [bacterium]
MISYPLITDDNFYGSYSNLNPFGITMKRLLLVLFLTFSGIICGLWRPFYSLCIYVWFAYMRPQEWLFGASWFAAMRPSLILAAVTIGGAIFNREKIFRFNKFTILLLLLWVWVTISWLNAKSPPIATFWMDYFTKLMILGCVMTGLVNSKYRIFAVIMTLVVTLGFYGGKSGLFGIITGGRIMEGPGGMIKDNNDFALAFNMILPFIYFSREFFIHPKYKKVKLALLGLFYLTVVGVVFTFSRGGFLGLIAVIILINLRSKQKFFSLIILALGALVILAFFIPEEYKARIGTITYEEGERDESIGGRLHFWEVALVMAQDYPLYGVGPGCYQVMYNDYDTSAGYYGRNRAVHNSYLQMLTNNGYPALALFLSLIALALITCAKLRFKVRKRKDLYWIHACASAFEISIVAYCVCGMFLSLAYADLIYHLFFMVSAFEHVALRHINAPQTQYAQTVVQAQFATA